MAPLTRQQLAVVVELAAGASNEQIGCRLHLSSHTVAAYLSEAMHRLEMSNRAGLVARCYSLGILDPSCWPPQPLHHRRRESPVTSRPSADV